MKYRLTTWFDAPEDLGHFASTLSLWMASELPGAVIHPRTERSPATEANLARALSAPVDYAGSLSFRAERNGASLTGRVGVPGGLASAGDRGTFECEFSIRPGWKGASAFLSAADLAAFLVRAAAATESALAQVEAADMPAEVSSARYAAFQSLPPFVPVSLEWITALRRDLAVGLGLSELSPGPSISWTDDYLVLRAGDDPFSYAAPRSVTALEEIERRAGLAELHRVRAVKKHRE